MIHIGRAGAKLGSFSEFEARQGLKSGRFLPTDLGWKEGMENWAPLSQFPELAPTPPPLPEPPELNPDPEPDSPSDSAAAEERPGLPWDYRSEIGFFPAFLQTARMVLFDPNAAFSRIRLDGPVYGALLYNLIGGCFGFIVNCIYAILVARIKPEAAPAPGAAASLFSPSPETLLNAFPVILLLGPIIVTTCSLVAAIVAHLSLMLVGGANKPFHVTLRVICFSYGSVQLFQIIPILSSVCVPIWMLLCCIIGLAAAHRTSSGRSIIAVSLLLIASFLCCLGLFFLAQWGASQGIQ